MRTSHQIAEQTREEARSLSQQFESDRHSAPLTDKQIIKVRARIQRVQEELDCICCMLDPLRKEKAKLEAYNAAAEKLRAKLGQG